MGMTTWPDNFEAGAIFVDPSMGADTKRGDFSAIVYVGRAKSLLWVDADIERRPPDEIVKATLRMYRRRNPDAIECESNGFQGTIADAIAQAALDDGLGRLVVLHKNNHVNKILRVHQGLDPYLAAHDIRIKDNPGGRMLLEQLRDFPLADHDDGPDALDGAIRLLHRILIGDLEE